MYKEVRRSRRGKLFYMIDGVIAVSTGMLTFAVLGALALPHLETGLTFLPIFVISVVVGFVAPKIYNRVKKSN